MTRSKTIRRWVAWSMVVTLVASIGIWSVTRDRLPGRIRIATAVKGGLYHKFATLLAPHLTKCTQRSVILLETEGTADNCRRLREGNADLAILQSGSAAMDGLIAIAPLYHDVVFVVVRRDRGIDSLRDLAGRSVVLGLHGSGMRASSRALLDHYDIDASSLRDTERYFLDLMTDESLDAAIITTGLTNPDLEKLLATGDFTILPIHEAEAYGLRNPAFRSISIPQGLYGHGPSLPPTPLPTIATTALLAARTDVSDLLVERTMSALYESNLRNEVPMLIPPGEVGAWTRHPLHPVALTYLNPYAGMDILTNFMESLAAGKELLFAFGAGMYLLWDRWRRLKEREQSHALDVMKERLDDLLADTARIERAQMDTVDTRELKNYLDEVTRIKLTALDELTDEGLRSDRMFLIFLMQCGNVINKIQAKISINLLVPPKNETPG